MLVFFGIVPVCMTFFVLAGCVTWQVFIASVACGLAIDCLLMVNNYRDRNQDEISGKRTLVVRFGRKSGLRMYLWLGLLAFALGSLAIGVVPGKCYSFLPLALYAVLHILVYRKMLLIDGKALNGVLGSTARNIFLFGVLFALSLLV